MEKFKKYLWPLLLVLILSGGFAGGIIFDQYNRPPIEKIQRLINPEAGKPIGVDFGIFWEVWRRVEEKHVDRKKLDTQKMIYGAITGMLKSLDDPYTVFFPPKEAKDFIQEMKAGEFGGVGIEIGMRKGVVTVIAPIEETPAFRAGVLAGDKILKVNETPTDDLTLDEVVKLIRGPKGTEVTLFVSRDGWKKTKEFKITRDVIKIPILKVSDKDGYIYVKFYQFTENAAEEFKNIVQQILTSNSRGIILDLRNNPGGYLEVAVDVSSWFLPRGKVVVTEDFGNGKKNEYKSSGYNKLNYLPMVILINQGSASASEILAGALRDHLKVKLIGEKTFGKGSVQQLEELKDGSSLKITVAKWLTPLGVSLTDNGLEPDVKAVKTEEDIENNRDPQLDAALETMINLH